MRLRFYYFFNKNIDDQVSYDQQLSSLKALLSFYYLSTSESQFLISSTFDKSNILFLKIILFYFLNPK